MRRVLVLLFASPLCLLGSMARADALPPELDPYMACEAQALGTACVSELGEGLCVEADCPSDPGKKCGYCDPKATATTSAGTDTGTGTTGADTTSATGDTSGSGSETAGGSSSDGGTSDGTSPKKEEGCSCRSDASPGAALGLLGLVGLMRRRRR
ncbi:MYXO-CTERM sorting domain-containing protein [Nannocystis pusilla]|uniref:MYXO-CTERM sorting domain-containing protein n=1 Tax=Nannocystis pusilla TaxID=889268 RepID=UPI003BF0AB82